MSTVTHPFLPADVRHALVENPKFGAGNFLHYAYEANPNRDAPLFWPERPFRTKSGEVFEHLSISQLKRVVDEYAAFYHALGVRRKDPIAIFIEEGIEHYVHLMALQSLGALPVMINSNQRPEIVARYMRNVGTVGAFFEPSREVAVRPHLEAQDLQRLRFIATESTKVENARLPEKYPYQHAADDISSICHSSGTTGVPKAAIESHYQHSVFLRSRFSENLSPSDRLLSAIPHSHAVGISLFSFSLVSGTPFMAMNDPGGIAVMRAIEKFRPNIVSCFPRTYVDMALTDMDAYDLSSVERWLNTADSAHEKHIRKIVQYGSRVIDGKRVSGGMFLDQLGSTELALPVFTNVHTKETNNYGRCIGRTHTLAEVAVLDEDGNPLGPNQVGFLGVKSPTIIVGYWNDSMTTCRTRLGGYWLTCDMGYRNNDGLYFHVDRIADVIKTKRGNVYSLPIEEVVMQSHPDVLDTVVVGMQVDEEFNEPMVIAHIKAGSALTEPELLEIFNARLRERDLSPLLGVVIVDSTADWPLGPSGKVLKRALRERYAQSKFVPSQVLP
jgi:acyl-coenzyme A synthetase/AMP-(fatty) acid ligase